MGEEKTYGTRDKRTKNERSEQREWKVTESPIKKCAKEKESVSEGKVTEPSKKQKKMGKKLTEPQRSEKEKE
jgi:hypothetical protein